MLALLVFDSYAATRYWDVAGSRSTEQCLPSRSKATILGKAG